MSAFGPVGEGVVKVVVATNSAESSITLPDVDNVICLGSCKEVGLLLLLLRLKLVMKALWHLYMCVLGAVFSRPVVHPSCCGRIVPRRTKYPPVSCFPVCGMNSSSACWYTLSPPLRGHTAVAPSFHKFRKCWSRLLSAPPYSIPRAPLCPACLCCCALLRWYCPPLSPADGVRPPNEPQDADAGVDIEGLRGAAGRQVDADSVPHAWHWASRNGANRPNFVFPGLWEGRLVRRRSG